MKKDNLFYAVVLAAGRGSRMESTTPKVLHPIGGQPMILHLMDTLREAGCHKGCLVTAPQMDEVRSFVPMLDQAIQEKQLGTAHAVLAAESFLETNKNPILILYGDTPLIKKETLDLMSTRLKECHLVVLGMDVHHAHSYGRIFADEFGFIDRIVESKETTANQRHNTLCNSGVMLMQPSVFSLLKKIGNQNASGEFYLTDLVEIAKKQGFKAKVIVRSYEELRGINSQQDLAEAEHVFQQRKRQQFMASGVRLCDPQTTYFSFDTRVGKDVVIEPFVHIGPQVIIEDFVTIKGFSYIEGSHIQPGAVIGPFARLRPETVVGPKAKIGNFVEVKKSTLGTGVKINHLSYVGDATIDSHSNIGAGTITCNYDGFKKHKTVIGKNVFVGSNTSLVAPVTVQDGSIVGAGTVVTQDVPQDALAVARPPQKNIDQGAKKFREKHQK